MQADSLPAEPQGVSLKLTNKIRFRDRIQLNGILLHLFMNAISKHVLCVYKVINVRELVIQRRITIPPITAPSGESAGVMQKYKKKICKKKKLVIFINTSIKST